MQVPFIGYRYSDSSAYSGSYGGYWSSSPYGSAVYAYHFRLYPTYLVASRDDYRGQGYAVRCFKNEYVKPGYSLIFDSQ